MTNPEVSVIMPAYNSAGFIKKSIEAVLNQTLSDFELIVVDDGSADNTFEIVNGIKDPRIKCFRKENAGAASARNYGLKNATGKYIAYCDADDRFATGHLKLLADYLDNHPEVGMVYSKAVKVELDGTESGGWGFPFERRKFEYFCLMVPSTVMHRRECLEKVGFWDEHPALRNVHEDWDFFLRISDVYPIAFIDVPTVLWLKLPEGLFLKSLKTQGYFIGLDYILKKRLGKFAKEKKEGKLAPLDGYYFYNFKTCSDAAKVGENVGAFKASQVYESRIIPLFEDLSSIDSSNLEIWLVLALLYFMQKKSSKVVEAAHKAKNLLDQKLEIDKALWNLVVSSLKGIVFELNKAGEKDLAAKFLEKIKEFPPT